MSSLGWTIDEWRDAARASGRDMTAIIALHETLEPSDPAWISIASIDRLAEQIAHIHSRRAQGDHMPLFGVPFAVKDNIDVAGFVTTAGCPAYGYRPRRSATTVKRLADAGAICLGKTNLDQFATGLVGTRSPFGAVPNSFNPDFISGGSSSGSASVVARGLVPFALGTDTAGSGRIPAGANNIVGLKPTRGAWSTTGLVPACRTLDCISVLTTTVADALTVDEVVRGHDPEDPFSRAAPVVPSSAPRRIGIPAAPWFFGDRAAQLAWERIVAAMDAEPIEIDFGPLHEVASLLYQGPWVAERMAAIEPFYADHRAMMDPVVAGIIEGAAGLSAADAFRGFYKLAALKPAADALMASVDALMVPTVPSHPTIAAVADDPVTLNNRLGTYTNFVNLLDWSAIAVPAGVRDDGLPFGVTLIGPAWAEHELAERAIDWESRRALPRGAFQHRREIVL